MTPVQLQKVKQARWNAMKRLWLEAEERTRAALDSLQALKRELGERWPKRSLCRKSLR